MRTNSGSMNLINHQHSLSYDMKLRKTYWLHTFYSVTTFTHIEVPFYHVENYSNKVSRRPEDAYTAIHIIMVLMKQVYLSWPKPGNSYIFKLHTDRLF